jgi:short-subunit dehydrogenase
VHPRGSANATHAKLAARGNDLVLVARRTARLERLAGELGAGHGVRVETLTANLADDGDLAAVAKRLAADDVTLLVNNAGINGYAPVTDADPQVLEAVVRINALAPVLLTRAVLPGLLARREGGIINVASLLAFSGGAGIGRMPRRATYAATKAHLVAFTRCLAEEVDGTGVRVQVVCPGYTATEFHLTNGTEPVSEEAAGLARDEGHAMPADDVVAASLVAFDRGEVVCVPGLDDPQAVAALARCEAALRQAARATTRAPRYQL